MRFQRNTRSSLFLIELIIAILFFSLGSAVCVQAFVKAHQTSQAASDLSFASAQASSAAAVLRYTDGTCEEASAYLTSASGSGLDFSVFYDSDQQPCSEGSAAYTMTVSTREDGNRRYSSISVYKADDELIYELETRYPAFYGSTADEDSSFSEEEAPQ